MGMMGANGMVPVQVAPMVMGMAPMMAPPPGYGGGAPWTA